MRHDGTLRRFESVIPGASRRGAVVLPAYHPANKSGRSMFPSRVYDPAEVGRVLKTGHQQRKIGKEVRKGARRGWPIFTLTLEERATCPRSCTMWAGCYGNHMQAGERIAAGQDLEGALARELLELQLRHPRGFMVRLHVLGDFYSLDYVDFWEDMLEQLPALHVFGFTARLPGTLIGDRLLTLAGRMWERFAVRFSGMYGPHMASQIIPDDDPQSITCPAQTGGTDCCATCALCWHSTRSIAFLKH